MVIEAQGKVRRQELVTVAPRYYIGVSSLLCFRIFMLRREFWNRFWLTLSSYFLTPAKNRKSFTRYVMETFYLIADLTIVEEIIVAPLFRLYVSFP